MKQKSVAAFFPNGAAFSSFEAGPQQGNIQYILPTNVGPIGSVLEIAGFAGGKVVLTWGVDNAAAREGDDLPTTIATDRKDQGTVDERIRSLQQELKRIELLEEKIHSLREELKRLKMKASETTTPQLDLSQR